VNRPYQLGIRWDLPPGEHGPNFDRVHRARGVVYAELSDEQKAEYDEEKRAHVRCSEGASRNRAELRLRDEAAFAWVEREHRAGRPVWGVEVPESWTRSYLARASSPQVRPVARAREGSGRRVDAGEASSGRDPPRPADVAGSYEGAA
jgi:hypothetical protein